MSRYDIAEYFDLPRSTPLSKLFENFARDKTVFMLWSDVFSCEIMEIVLLKLNLLSYFVKSDKFGFAYDKSQKGKKWEKRPLYFGDMQKQSEKLRSRGLKTESTELKFRIFGKNHPISMKVGGLAAFVHFAKERFEVRDAEKVFFTTSQKDALKSCKSLDAICRLFCTGDYEKEGEYVMALTDSILGGYVVDIESE